MWLCFGGIFDLGELKNRLEEVELQLAAPNVWDDADFAQKLNKERVTLDRTIGTVEDVAQGVEDAGELIELAFEEKDKETLEAVESDIALLDARLADLEFRRMFDGEMDENNAFMDIQSGSGGTEAQDWAEMLLRMYLRWGEKHKFTTELIEYSAGDIAGIKSASIRFSGEYAFGWLRTETGVHRLVRKSPFDSGSRRHTSFASIFVAPEIDDDIEIEINPADVPGRHLPGEWSGWSAC